MKLGTKLGVLASSATLAAIIAGVSPALTAQAQATAQPTAPATTAPTAEMTMLPCTLAAADCQLLSDARGNILKETSFVQNFTFKVALTGDHPVNVQASGAGAFSVDPTMISAASMKDPSALLKSIQGQLDVSATSTMGTLQESGKTGVVFKDGVLYGLNPVDNTWTGIDIVQALTTMIARRGANPSAMMPNPMGTMMMHQMMANPDVKAAMMALYSTKGFITQQRLTDDATLEGQKMAQFQTTINPQVLFTPDGLPAIKALITAMASMNPRGERGIGGMGNLSKLSDQQLQGLLMLIGPVFGKTNVTVTRWIGEDDKLYHALDVELNLNIDPTSLDNNANSTPVNGTISFNVQLTKVGQPVTITAPAGAKLIDPGMISRGMGMGMGMIGPRPSIKPLPATGAMPTMAATMAATASQ